MKNLVEKIESPLSIFNNIMLEIGNDLSNIYNYDLYGTNNCIFDNDSVLIFGYIKISRINDSKSDILLQFKKKLKESDFEIITKTIDNWKDIKAIVFKYFLMLDTVTENLDSSIKIDYVKSILRDVKKSNLHDKIYLIPYKNKIFENLDNHDKTLENVFCKFSYVLNLMKTTKNYYKFSIIRVLSSDLNENNSLESIRPLEKDYLYEGTVHIDNIGKFLKNLMFYGNIEC